MHMDARIFSAKTKIAWNKEFKLVSQSEKISSPFAARVMTNHTYFNLYLPPSLRVEVVKGTDSMILYIKF